MLDPVTQLIVIFFIACMVICTVGAVAFAISLSKEDARLKKMMKNEDE